ncbi:sulfurtransferase [Comamonas serinivorans]|uniref:Sulfurtransferase n=1 Tax=Comamonas serinivorans TaxID=1082851 RepID=A0A1Y0EQ35_9BURK|nr:rhodanese-like domain-containing protein [Comamonas serinivorans]ARU05409.1 sulfurtransferase [Comamonas serinivorans]
MIDQVSPRQLAAWGQHHQQQGRLLVLDVREPAELQIAGVRPDGFDLLTIPMHDVPQRMNELDPDRPIACLCHHGGRSQQVAHFLAQRGFTCLANVAGGIDAWSSELDQTVPRY